MFYYLNGRFSLTNGLLIVPDGEVPEGREKINLKQLYEMFKDTNSHGLVSLQFLCADGIFFGVDKSITKSAITELYKNLSYETLSGARDLDFQAVFDLILEVNFQIKRSTLLNRKRKEEDNESNLKIKEERDIFKLPDQFEEDKANGWGLQSLLEVENAYELLTVFQMFYYLNGRFSLTNGLLIVPDGEVPEGREKINLKQLYEMFKDTNSHGLVSLKFLCADGIFFGVDKSITKSAITELYKSLSYETLNGARDLDFQAVFDLILEVNFQIKHSTLLNRKRKEEDNESNLKIKEERDIFKLPDQFEEELVEDLFKPLEHKN